MPATKTAKLDPAAFRKRFEHLVKNEAPPLTFNYP